MLRHHHSQIQRPTLRQKRLNSASHLLQTLHKMMDFMLTMVSLMLTMMDFMLTMMGAYTNNGFIPTSSPAMHRTDHRTSDLSQ